VLLQHDALGDDVALHRGFFKSALSSDFFVFFCASFLGLQVLTAGTDGVNVLWLE